MRLLLSLLLFALPALTAHAMDEMPSGEFVLVNSILPGPIQRATVPVYVHMTLTDGHMEFRFIPAGTADALSCQQARRCEKAVNALGLDYVIEDGRIAVTVHEIRAESVIDHAESDLPLIIEPMLHHVDGASITADDNEVVFRSSGGSVARFLSSSLEDASNAMAFARHWDISLHDLDRCVVRQVSALRLLDDAELSQAERNLLEAVEISGLSDDLEQAGQYWDFMPDAPEAGSPEIARLRAAANYLRFVPFVISQYPNASSEKALTIALEWLSEAETFDTAIFDEYVVPNWDGLLQLGRYEVWFRNLLTQGQDPVEHLCNALVLAE